MGEDGVQGHWGGPWGWRGTSASGAQGQDGGRFRRNNFAAVLQVKQGGSGCIRE